MNLQDQSNQCEQQDQRDKQDQNEQQNGTQKKRAPHKKARVVCGILIAIVACLTIAFFLYMRPVSATDDAYSALDYSGQTVFVPQGMQESDSFQNGLVFYPGALIEPVAYAPLMQKLASQGWICILVDAPFHFSLFNIDAAAEPIASHSSVAHWYVGGHSLGGVAATSFAKQHTEQVAGIVLLASCANDDVSQTNFHVIGVYGTNDGVLSPDLLEDSSSNLPSRYDELIIEGANHAQFGNYGEQNGDNPADISREEQQQATASFIATSAAA